MDYLKRLSRVVVATLLLTVIDLAGANADAASANLNQNADFRSFNFPVTYRLVDVAMLDGSSTFVRAINNNGIMVGSFHNAGRSRAFRSTGNLPIDPSTDSLGAIGPWESIAFGVNELGQAAGWVQVGRIFSEDEFEVALFPATGANVAADSLIGRLFGSRAIGWDVNDLGQVVGDSAIAGDLNSSRGFRTGPNLAINPVTDDIGDLGSNPTHALAINNLGQVVGSSRAGESSHAFRTGPNQPINPTTDDLGTFGGRFSVARDINESGWVVGRSSTPDNSSRAFLTPPGRAIDPNLDNLGILPGFDSVDALAVNESLVVVGVLRNLTTQVAHAFVHEGNAMYDLNDLLEPDSGAGWVLDEAVDIDDHGRIVGHGIFSGERRSFLLIPIPEPSSALLLLAGSGTFITFPRRCPRSR